jgi:hypothetical protein
MASHQPRRTVRSSPSPPSFTWIGGLGLRPGQGLSWWAGRLRLLRTLPIGYAPDQWSTRANPTEEAQRIKLATELQRIRHGHPVVPARRTNHRAASRRCRPVDDPVAPPRRGGTLGDRRRTRSPCRGGSGLGDRSRTWRRRLRGIGRRNGNSGRRCSSPIESDGAVPRHWPRRALENRQVRSRRWTTADLVVELEGIEPSSAKRSSHVLRPFPSQLLTAVAAPGRLARRPAAESFLDVSVLSRRQQSLLPSPFASVAGLR